MMDGLQISIPRRLVLLRITLSLAIILSMFMTFNLWAGSRFFPRMPISPEFELGMVFECVLAGLAVIFLGGSMFFRWERVLVGAALLCLVLLVLSDLNRLQPWFYLYASMLTVFLFYNGRVDDANHYTAIFVLLQIIFVSVYFFSGLDLIFPAARDEMENYSSPVRRFVSERQFAFLLRSTVIIPYLLVFTGIGLLLPALRYLALSIAVIGHLVLIWLFFPTGSYPEYAEWFVHFTFLSMLPLLCSGRTSQRHFSFAAMLQKPVFYICIVAFMILPFARFTGITNIHLPRTPGMLRPSTGLITFEPRVYMQLPYYLRIYCDVSGKEFRLNHLRWSRYELHSSCYPVPRVYENIRSYIAQEANVEKEVVKLKIVENR